MVRCNDAGDRKIDWVKIASETYEEQDFFLSELYANCRNPSDVIEKWYALVNSRASR
jgi:hypothetical protein